MTLSQRLVQMTDEKWRRLANSTPGIAQSQALSAYAAMTQGHAAMLDERRAHLERMATYSPLEYIQERTRSYLQHDLLSVGFYSHDIIFDHRIITILVEHSNAAQVEQKIRRYIQINPDIDIREFEEEWCFFTFRIIESPQPPPPSNSGFIDV